MFLACSNLFQRLHEKCLGWYWTLQGAKEPWFKGGADQLCCDADQYVQKGKSVREGFSKKEPEYEILKYEVLA